MSDIDSTSSDTCEQKEKILESGVHAQPLATPLFRGAAHDLHTKGFSSELLIRPTLWRSGLIIAIFALLIGFLAWASQATLSHTASVSGFVTTPQAAVDIRITQPGLVTSLQVHEGDRVEKNQLLAKVDLTALAEAGPARIGKTSDSIDSQIRSNQARIQISNTIFETKISQLKTSLSELLRQTEFINEQINIQGSVISSMAQSLNRIRKAAEEGYITRDDLEKRLQAFLAADILLSQFHEQASLLNDQISRARSEIILTQANKEDASHQSNIETQNLVQHQLETARNQSGYVVTPIAGYVAAVQIDEGTYVDAQHPLMTVLPTLSLLEVQFYAPSRAIGFVQEGQAVRVMFDAFPYERFGTFSGRVKSVSLSATVPANLETPVAITEGVYQIKVILDQQPITPTGQILQLRNKMKASADIILGRESIIKWLLEPVMSPLRRRVTQ